MEISFKYQEECLHNEQTTYNIILKDHQAVLASLYYEKSEWMLTGDVSVSSRGQPEPHLRELMRINKE